MTNLLVCNEMLDIEKIHLASCLDGLCTRKVCRQYIYCSVTGELGWI